MQKVKEKILVSLLLDPSAQVWTEETTEIPAVHSTEQLRKSVAAFKDSLKFPTAELNEKQEINPFSARRYRITALYFGEIFKCFPTTTPHRLVLCIIDPKPFNCAAIEWGKTHEACALEECQKHHYSRGNPSVEKKPLLLPRVNNIRRILAITVRCKVKWHSQREHGVILLSILLRV